MPTTDVIRKLTPALLLTLGLPLAGAADLTQNKHHPSYPVSQTLIDKVFAKNKIWSSIDYARNSGWKDLTTCVTGPEKGAMGIHLFMKSRLMNGTVDPDEPEVLIYEPLGKNLYGKEEFRLVGVEFVIPAALWQPTPEAATPSVDGNQMHYIPGPNRYGPDALYELHVWAFQRNPLGAYTDWNTLVSCEKQPAD